mmetsp:Transcript_80184/g.144784  ORF Transcript_80184/g.144784 Transcript_80184/m.144784 type:complete len:672 (-) Transcript_80184:29-2044(-)
MFDFEDLPDDVPEAPKKVLLSFPHLLGRTARGTVDASHLKFGECLPQLGECHDVKKASDKKSSSSSSSSCPEDPLSPRFGSSSSEAEEEPEFLEFPEGFVFGAATAAYQLEGAANEGGRLPSIWDKFSRREGATANGATGDVACDHYHRFRDDVGIMAQLGIKAYRFSISWSRLIPEGEGAVNKEGATFYSDLIDALLEKGIEPWVTLYHWDLPLELEERFRGWLGPKRRIVAAFGAFARACFRLFGSRVKRWMTINEPYCIAIMGYASGSHAPGRHQQPATEPYLVAHNLLLAHAEAVRIYRTEFLAKQGGQIGIVLNVSFREASNSADDLELRAAQRLLDFELGWFADPIFKGDYPARMRETCGERLPKFTKAERALLLGSSDFLGVNYYFATFASAPKQRVAQVAQSEEDDILSPVSKRRASGGLLPGVTFWGDVGVRTEKDPGWESTDMGWAVTPWGLREVALLVTKTYAPPCGVVITENGCAFETAKSQSMDADARALVPQPYDPSCKDVLSEDFANETFADHQRVRFLRTHLSVLHSAIAGGANVQGFFVWSLMDNFEWSEGYGKRFGIVRVDYTSQKRTIKESGRFYSDVVRRHGLDELSQGELFAATFKRPSTLSELPTRRSHPTSPTRRSHPTSPTRRPRADGGCGIPALPAHLVPGRSDLN